MPLALDDKMLTSALIKQGIEADVVAWEDQYPWATTDFVINRSTWNYYYHPEAYLSWAHKVTLSTTLHNPLPVLEWNINKWTYLQDLAAAGFPLIPSQKLEQGRTYDLAEILEERRWSQAVLKPSIGGNSYGTQLISLGTLNAQNRWIRPSKNGLIQPFISTIETIPEHSHVFIDHAWSHAFGKADAFRARLESTMVEITEPPAEEIALAERLMQFVRQRFGRLLYGRVDLIRDESGELRVMELELADPVLHLEFGAALSRFTESICNHLAHEQAV